MTIADLIRELQELNLDPDTPVRFFANGYDCDSDVYIASKCNEVHFGLYSSKIEMLDQDED